MGVPGKITAFPNGVSSFGLPILTTGVPPWGGGNVVWVGNAGNPHVTPAGNGSAPTYPCSSLFGTGGGLAKVNGLQGSTIFILPGHVETIAAAVSVKALANPSTLTNGAYDLNIIGLGQADDRPTFNWSAAASSLAFDVNGLWFRNLVWNLSSTAATVVTAAVTAANANCGMDTLQIITATSATQLTTTAINIGTGANKFSAINTTIAAGTASTYATNPTDIFKVTAAVDQLYVGNCDFQCATNATGNGVINVAAAATNMIIENNVLANYKASSTVALIGTASMTGDIRYNDCVITAASGAASAINTPGSAWLTQNFGAVQGKAGILIGTLST